MKLNFKIYQIKIGNIKAPFNLKEPKDYWIGRKTEIYEIMKIITQDKKCVNIYGKKGIGKTTFSKLFGYYVYSRLLFKHGVFYFSFKDLKQYNDDMKELMKKELGEDFSKYIQTYFENKSILFIFDDFDTIINSGNEIIFKHHIFHSLNKEKILYIICSRKNLMMEGVESHKLGLLSQADSQELLDFKFSQYSAIYKDFNKQKSLKREKGKMMRETKVHPQKIIEIIKEIKKEMNERKRNISSPAPPKRIPSLKKDNSTRDFRTLKKKSKNHDDADSLFSSPPMTHAYSYNGIKVLELEKEESKDRSTSSKFDAEETNSFTSGTNNFSLENPTENNTVPEIEEEVLYFFFKISKSNKLGKRRKF